MLNVLFSLSSAAFTHTQAHTKNVRKNLNNPIKIYLRCLSKIKWNEGKKAASPRHCMLAYLFTHGFCIILLLLLRSILLCGISHATTTAGMVFVCRRMNACKLNDIAIIFFCFVFVEMLCFFLGRRTLIPCPHTINKVRVRSTINLSPWCVVAVMMYFSARTRFFAFVSRVTFDS